MGLCDSMSDANLELNLEDCILRARFWYWKPNWTVQTSCNCSCIVSDDFVKFTLHDAFQNIALYIDNLKVIYVLNIYSCTLFIKNTMISHFIWYFIKVAKVKTNYTYNHWHFSSLFILILISLFRILIIKKKTTTKEKISHIEGCFVSLVN